MRLNTYKEGLLSRMGHDLLLDIRGFTITAQHDSPERWQVSVNIDKNSFYVREPEALSAKDKAEIHENICKHLPGNLRFEGAMTKRSRQEAEVQGQLSLGGSSTSIRFAMRLHQGLATGHLDLSHKALRIKPYRAPLGLIRLQDRMKLSFSLDLGSLLDTSEP